MNPEPPVFHFVRSGLEISESYECFAYFKYYSCLTLARDILITLKKQKEMDNQKEKKFFMLHMAESFFPRGKRHDNTNQN
ncbi:hypothetical protein L6452_32386 [Arctium lappa]|uniref:Uncharacterized protein n=1 Tax=Arctium lappa TaxID=4217 RepID=A0ACB8Z4H3_ARCLA|nr:hypothetical protein L6452_32386 [Arctium lappa]